jgi:hypothetical protein
MLYYAIAVGLDYIKYENKKKVRSKTFTWVDAVGVRQNSGCYL